MGHNKQKGLVTLVVLVFLLVGLGLSVTLLKTAGQELTAQTLRQEARQWAELLWSLEQVRKGEPLLEPGEKRTLPAVAFRPDCPSVRAELEGSREGIVQKEKLTLLDEKGWPLLVGERVALAMPGVEEQLPFLPAGICEKGRENRTLLVDWDLLRRAAASDLPGKRRLELPLEGEFCRGEGNWNLETQLTGRGVLVIGSHTTFRRGSRVQGDFRILSQGNVLVCSGARLQNVYLYAGGNLVLQKGCRVRGILAARGKVTVEPGAEFTSDGRVLEAFVTSWK